MNKPYVREGGIKITKETPYINQYPNRRDRRSLGQKRMYSNKKGIQLIITQLQRDVFQKVKKDFQRLKGRTIVQFKLTR